VGWWVDEVVAYACVEKKLHMYDRQGSEIRCHSSKEMYSSSQKKSAHGGSGTRKKIIKAKNLIYMKVQARPSLRRDLIKSDILLSSLFEYFWKKRSQ